MLYAFLKIVARTGIRIFCRKIVVNKADMLRVKGPVLLACNHPNSFLDSVILDTIFQDSIWSLARGDVFKKPFYIRLLTALKILPVYRTSEGVENLSENYKTFEDCLLLFRKNGIVAIFSEGKCINEWHLRPLKKGTARLAIKAWEDNIPLQVLPVGINYSSYTRFGKNMLINFGEPVTRDQLNLQDPDGLRYQAFNTLLRNQLEQLVLEIPKKDRKKQEELLTITVPVWKRILLAIPAAIGYIMHLPLYIPIKRFTWKRTHDNDHFDSVMTGILMLTYPLYLLLLCIIGWIFLKTPWIFSILLLLPFCAWAYVQLKAQLDV